MVHRFALAAAAVLLGGCAYHLGNLETQQLAGIRSVYVPVVRNETYEPALAVTVTDAIISRLHKDGTLKVMREDDADSTLLVTLKEVNRRPLRNVQGDVRLSSEMEMELQAEVTFVKHGTTKPVIDKEKIMGDTQFFIGQDLQEGERQALGLVADRLAGAIVSRVTEDW